MQRCPSCRAPCADLAKHYGHSRACSMESEKAPASRAQSTTVGVEADSQFKAKFARALNLGYAALRYKRFIDTSMYAWVREQSDDGTDPDNELLCKYK